MKWNQSGSRLAFGVWAQGLQARILEALDWGFWELSGLEALKPTCDAARLEPKPRK